MKALFDYLWLFTFVPLIIGLIRWNKGDRAFRNLVIYLITCLVNEGVMYFLGTRGFIIVEFLLLVSVFYYGYKEIFSSNVYYLLMGGFVVGAILNIIFLQPLKIYASNTRSVEGILLTLLALWCLHRSVIDLREPKLSKSFMFWFSVAILCFFTTKLLIYLFSTSLILFGNSSEENKFAYYLIMIMHASFAILYYLIMARAFLGRPTPDRPYRFF